MSNLPPGTSQANIDTAAGSEEAQCASCGCWIGDIGDDLLLFCEECEEKMGVWQCEICLALRSMPEDEPWVCEGCESLVCQSHVVSVPEAETFLCEECARAARG